MPGVPAGNYYVLAYANRGVNFTEFDTANNLLATPIQVLNPDLMPLSFNVPASSPASMVQVFLSVTNLAGGVADGRVNPWNDTVYISTNAQFNLLSAQPLQAFVETTNLPGHGFYRQTNMVTLPNLPSGTYYITLYTVQNGTLYEPIKTNNTLTVPLVINKPAQASLEVQNVKGPLQDALDSPCRCSGR